MSDQGERGNSESSPLINNSERSHFNAINLNSNQIQNTGYDGTRSRTNSDAHHAKFGTRKWQWWERPIEPRGKLQTINFVNNSTSTTSNSPMVKNAHHSGADIEEHQIGSLAPSSQKVHKKLNQVFATAISGNDITSSVLYVSGYAAYVCGIYSPVALLLVAVLLALYKPIYTEVVTALPMNGGTYNALLNTTSKMIASVAGALSLLSYVATAVVSSTSAMQYLQAIWKGLYIEVAVIVVLGLFAILNIIGITESSYVATGLFVTHCITLFMLIILSIIYVCEHGFHTLIANFHDNTSQPAEYRGMNPAQLIFLGYGVSMLGITGFETSANYVEEQADGVFPKTLRNMWFAVAFFNPVIAFLSLCVLPLKIQVADPGALLANIAQIAAGGNITFDDAGQPVIDDPKWFYYWISIDAVLVLSGGVLTAYVGVVGLGKRLALDRILPQFLLAENKWRHTVHWVIISFFLLCSSLFVIIGFSKNPTEIQVSSVNTLSGVYTAAFLCVMAMFAVANMMLKYKRARLPRLTYTPWPIVILAFLGVVTAFVANLLANKFVIVPFVMYFLITMSLFILMFMRIHILKIILYFVKIIIKNERVQNAIASQIQQINSTKVIFFTRDDNLSILNKAVLYIRDNEQTNWILMVCVARKPEDMPKKLEEHCGILDQAYPKFRIDPVLVTGEFGPNVIDELSTMLGVPKNFMFITTPSENFAHKLSDFGGIRLVTR